MTLISSLLLITSFSLPEKVSKYYRPFQNHSVDIYLVMKDSTELYLSKREYIVGLDTVCVFDQEKEQKSKVAFDQIAYVEANVFNEPLTCFFDRSSCAVWISVDFFIMVGF